MPTIPTPTHLLARGGQAHQRQVVLSCQRIDLLACELGKVSGQLGLGARAQHGVARWRSCLNYASQFKQFGRKVRLQCSHGDTAVGACINLVSRVGTAH